MSNQLPCLLFTTPIFIFILLFLCVCVCFADLLVTHFHHCQKKVITVTKRRRVTFKPHTTTKASMPSTEHKALRPDDFFNTYADLNTNTDQNQNKPAQVLLHRRIQNLTNVVSHQLLSDGPSSRAPTTPTHTLVERTAQCPHPPL